MAKPSPPANHLHKYSFTSTVSRAEVEHDKHQVLEQQTPIFPAAGHPKMSLSPWFQFQVYLHADTTTLIKLYKTPFSMDWCLH